MNDWQQRFVEKIETLKEQSVNTFESVVKESVEPVFQAFVEFTARCGFQHDSPQMQKGLRSYRFALSEDGFVLLFFRTHGITDLEFEFECFVRGSGRAEPVRSTCNLSTVSREWVESRFQETLDTFVASYSKSACLQEAAELVGV